MNPTYNRRKANHECTRCGEPNQATVNCKKCAREMLDKRAMRGKAPLPLPICEDCGRIVSELIKHRGKMVCGRCPSPEKQK